MVLRCPVGVLVLCVVTDPACQSNGQPYTVVQNNMGGLGRKIVVACLIVYNELVMLHDKEHTAMEYSIKDDRVEAVFV
jgi:hypothetical protein